MSFITDLSSIAGSMGQLLQLEKIFSSHLANNAAKPPTTPPFAFSHHDAAAFNKGLSEIGHAD